jgi:histidine triad (HIT) family protein
MPTTPPIDPRCPFCDIVAHQEDDAREVFRTAQVVAFFPLEPATLGHTLLIPRVHVRDIWDPNLNLNLTYELSRCTVRLAEAVKRAIRPDGLNIIQSNGAAATQTVMHLHVHVVPRWQGDALGQIWPVETHYSENQKDEAWHLLREEFRK